MDNHKIGRPKADKPKDVIIRCRVTKEFDNELEIYCKETGRTKSDVIIEGVRKVIQKK